MGPANLLLCPRPGVLIISSVTVGGPLALCRLKSVPDHDWQLSLLWDVNIPNVVMAQRHSFELA